MPPASATMRMEPGDTAPRRARTCVRLLCGDRVSTDLLETALLLVSELVTNAYLHGARAIVLTVTCDADASSVTVTVGDDSAGMPVLRPSDPGAVGGRGLPLIDALADSWGVVRNDLVTRDGVAKNVWFRLGGTAAC